MAYPASLDDRSMTHYNSLSILVADSAGTQYQKFSTKFGGSVYVYSEMATGSFVLSAHSGVMAGSGRALEAEPLRQLIEGNIHAARPMAEIEARLERLIGREFTFSQGDATARFRLVRARRMGAATVAEYRHKAGRLSEFVAPVADPGRSFILFFCSGRQSGEPQQTYAGRYLLVLELID
jgi:hypothetical protein